MDVATKAVKPDESNSNSQSTKHAMTVLRAFDDSAKYEYSVITIQDDGLQGLLLYALSHHLDFCHATTVTFMNLCEPLIHNWSSLSILAENDQSNAQIAILHESINSASSNSPLASLKGPVGNVDRATADLKLLLDQVRDIPGLEGYFLGARMMQETAKTINFDYLWTIFPPGEIVISRPFMGQLQAFIVRESTGYISTRRGTTDNREWYLGCWTYDYNGSTFDRIPVEFTFEEFKGTKSITSLHCCPLKFHIGNSEEEGVVKTSKSGKGTMVEVLITRGKEYRALCIKERGKQTFDYDGIALSRGTGVRKIAKSSQVRTCYED